MIKIKAVLVGCGSIAKAWLEALNKFDDLELVAIVDTDSKATAKVQAESKDEPLCYDNAEIAISTHKPQVVFDCTPPNVHSKIAEIAFKHNCHLLGEKPISDNLESAINMVEQANKKDLTYAVIQNRRYDKNIIACRKSLDSGKIGKLTTINADFYIGAHFGGFRDEMDNVLLADMAIHTFDQARFLANCDPVAVYCHEWNPTGSWYKGNASAIAIFEMTGGIVFTYRGSWCSEGMNTTWECDWRLIGTKGSILWDGGEKINGETIEKAEGFTYPQKAFEVEATDIEHSNHSGVIREFIDCIKTGNKPQTICDDNIKSFAMVHAAIESAKSGKRILINDIIK